MTSNVRFSLRKSLAILILIICSFSISILTIQYNSYSRPSPSAQSPSAQSPSAQSPLGKHISDSVQSGPRMAVATLIYLDPTDYQNNSYIQNALVLLRQLKRYNQGPKVDYLLLYCGKGPLLSEPLELPKKLQEILKGMGVIPMLVPEGEGTPIYWFYKMEIAGIESYTRTIAKIHLWTLEDQYDKILYIDSDTITTSDAITPLFNLSQGHDFSAVYDIFLERSNYFNAGLFVLRPSKKVYENMVKFFGNGTFEKENQQEWDHQFADQDFLNFYFGASWNILPEKYNVVALWYFEADTINSGVVLHDKIWTDEISKFLPMHILNSYQADLLSVQNLLNSE